MLKIFWFLLTLVCVVVADVDITSPASGKTFTVSGDSVTVDIKWDDDGDDPSLDDIETYTLTLCTGPNTDITALKTLTSSTKKITSFSAEIDADTGADGNYYIQVYAQFKEGYTIHYSPRFKLSGMSGTKKASGSGSEPDAQYSLEDSGATANSKSFSVTYTLQTGKTRYAPMQLQPGSKITASTWSRRHATSSVSYYTTNTHHTVVGSTITPGWSYTMSSLVNYATPAPFPSELSWYAASARLQSATLSDSSAKKRMMKKRWDD